MWNVGMGIEFPNNYCSIVNDVLFLYFFHPYIPIILWKKIFVSCYKLEFLVRIPAVHNFFYGFF